MTKVVLKCNDYENVEKPGNLHFPLGAERRPYRLRHDHSCKLPSLLPFRVITFVFLVFIRGSLHLSKNILQPSETI